MPHEPPLLKVSRPVAACTRCRIAKTKCDGRLPACSSCVRAGKAAECSSEDDQFARGKERSYPAFLESKLYRLHKKLSEVKRGELSPPSIATPGPLLSESIESESGATDVSSRPPPSPQVRPRNSRTKGETTDIDELVSNFGVLTVNAASRDYQGFSSLMSVARVTLWTLIRDRHIGPVHPLPTRHEATEIGREYLNNIFQILPVIEEANFWTSLEAVYCPSPNFASPFNHFVVRMVLANGLITRSAKYGDNWHQLAGAHADSAMWYAEHVLRPDDISGIQAMLLLVEYSRYDPQRYDPWMVTGAVSRAMVDLGLHQDPPKSSSLTKNHMEARRRVFMCVYSMDRLIGMGMNRAFSFSDASVNVDISAPLLGLGFSGAAAPSLWNKSYEFGYLHFKIRHIQSEVYTDLYQSGSQTWKEPYTYIWAKWHEIQKWFDDLPATRPRALHHLTALEKLATFIQLLVPCKRVPVICELAQSLVFEYSLEYTANMQIAMDDSQIGASLSYTSGLRVRKIAGMFINNLNMHKAHLLSGATPKIEPAGAGCAPPPPYPYPPRLNNVERTLGFIHQMRGILGYLGRKCGVPGWAASFEAESQPIADTLL